MAEPPVLVAYASKHASTAEIAQRIASAMREAGCDAQAIPAAEVDDVSGYRAVVLGSAVYAKRWQRDARRFARRHDAALRARPVWLFSSGPFGSVDEHPTAPTPPIATKLLEQLGAREHVMFGGRVPTDPGNFVERAMLKNTPPERRDARDWAAIEAWARAVATTVVRTDTPPPPARMETDRARATM
jgi:menaquinone-dependent protoporphyrinogen oxidase